MVLVRDLPYSRSEIAAELRTGKDDLHAVLVRRGRAVAVVVNEKGKNPFNGKDYVNVMSPTSFTMQGENDDRGHRLEDPANILHLFFMRTGERGYRYEGQIRFEPPTTEWATRTFVRIL